MAYFTTVKIMYTIDTSILFCFVLFCFVLFCFVLFCFVLFCFVLFCFVLFCFPLISSGPPSVPTLSCVGLSGNVSGALNVTVRWTLSSGDSADFYLINITTNAPQTPYDGLLNITAASVTLHELTGFMAGFEYDITVRGVNCGNLEGRESEPLTITPQGKYNNAQCTYVFISTFVYVVISCYKTLHVTLVPMKKSLGTRLCACIQCMCAYMWVYKRRTY